MKIKLYFNAQFVGSFSNVVEVSNDFDIIETPSLFPIHMGVEYKEDTCGYKKLIECPECESINISVLSWTDYELNKFDDYFDFNHGSKFRETIDNCRCNDCLEIFENYENLD